MKYCEDFAALLDPYIDGELSPEETARVREHLRSCDGCRAYVQAALTMRDAFPAAEDTEVPAGFAEGVMAAIRADAAPRKRRRPQMCIRDSSSRKGVASFRALKVPVYSFCQQSSHRAQPRQTFSAARSKITAGFSSVDTGALRPMLSYRSRRAAAMRVSWARCV